MTTTTATIDPAAETRRVAELIVKSLTDLGYAYQTQMGELVRVRFSTVGYGDMLGGTWAICEVDTLRLPRRVTARDLVKPETLHHVSTVCGHQVVVLNSVGVTYCARLTPAPRPARLPSRVDLDLSLRPDGTLLVPVGLSTDGHVWRALPKIGHALIAGASGSGKSTWLQCAIAGLVTGSGTDQLRLALVDPKRVEFAAWAGVPHLWGTVAHDVDDAERLIAGLLHEIDRRAELLAGALVRDLASYNRQSLAPLPYILLIVDEALDLALQAGDRSTLVRDLARLASKGRACGLFIWLAAQHPKADVLPRVVTLNLSTRVIFRVLDEAAARVAGCPGAERIRVDRPGRCLVRFDGSPAMIQGYNLADEALAAVAGTQAGAMTPAISDAERRLIAYAVEHLDGCFAVGKLTAADLGWTNHGIKRLAQRWELLGWLSAPRHATDARRVTPELLRLAGISEDQPT